MMTGNFVNGEVHSADVDDSLIRLQVDVYRSDNNKDQLSLTNPRDAQHHVERAANK